MKIYYENQHIGQIYRRIDSGEQFAIIGSMDGRNIGTSKLNELEKKVSELAIDNKEAFKDLVTIAKDALNGKAYTPKEVKVAAKKEETVVTDAKSEKKTPAKKTTTTKKTTETKPAAKATTTKTAKTTTKTTAAKKTTAKKEAK